MRHAGKYDIHIMFSLTHYVQTYKIV